MIRHRRAMPREVKRARPCVNQKCDTNQSSLSRILNVEASLLHELALCSGLVEGVGND